MISTLLVIYWHVVQPVDTGGCEHKPINTSSLFSYLSVLHDLTLCIVSWIWFFFFSAEISVFQIFRVRSRHLVYQALLWNLPLKEPLTVSGQHIPFLSQLFYLLEEYLRQNHTIVGSALAFQSSLKHSICVQGHNVSRKNVLRSGENALQGKPWRARSAYPNQGFAVTWLLEDYHNRYCCLLGRQNMIWKGLSVRLRTQANIQMQWSEAFSWEKSRFQKRNIVNQWNKLWKEVVPLPSLNIILKK